MEYSIAQIVISVLMGFGLVGSIIALYETRYSRYYYLKTRFVASFLVGAIGTYMAIWIVTNLIHWFIR